MVITRRIALSLVPFVPAALARGQRRSSKGGSIEIASLAVRRDAEERAISIEGRLRNSGPKAIRRLTLVFHLIAPGGEEVSRPRGDVEEESLDPGAETEFAWRIHDHARAVDIRVTAVAAGDNDVAVDKPGPYPID